MAQTQPVKWFDQLNVRRKVRDAIWVTHGWEREIKGRITSFAPDAIGVEAEGSRTPRADEVRFVWNRRHDSLANGALIGAVVGFGAAAALLDAASTGDERAVGVVVAAGR
jgi:hypothetical protein